MKIKWLLLLLFLAGCRPTRPAPASTGTATPWPGYVFTQDIKSLRPVLFKAEDMDWPAETYRELTEVRIGSPLVAYQDKAQAIMGTEPIPPETRKGEPTIRAIGVSQIVWSYADEATAIQAFEAEYDRYSLSVGPVSGIQFELEPENALIGCNSAWDSVIGNYQNCGFLIQYGSYLTMAQMDVDGDAATMDDWNDFVSAVHGRLLVQVAQESGAAVESADSP
jgi:hypothetical protein